MDLRAAVVKELERLSAEADGSLDGGSLSEAASLYEKVARAEFRPFRQRWAFLRLVETARLAGDGTGMSLWAMRAHAVAPNTDTRCALVASSDFRVLELGVLPALATIDSPEGYLGAGKTFRLLGEPRRAMIVYLRGRRRFPADTALLNASAGALRDLGEPEMAASVARQSLGVCRDPRRNPAGCVALGLALCDLHRYGEAASLADEVLEHRPRDGYATWLRVRSLHANHPLAAIDLVGTAVRAGISVEWFWEWLGRRQAQAVGAGEHQVIEAIDQLVDSLGGRDIAIRR